MTRWASRVYPVERKCFSIYLYNGIKLRDRVKDVEQNQKICLSSTRIVVAHHSSHIETIVQMFIPNLEQLMMYRVVVHILMIHSSNKGTQLIRDHMGWLDKNVEKPNKKQYYIPVDQDQTVTTWLANDKLTFSYITW